MDTEDEYRRRGHFERIFPTTEVDKYIQYFAVQRYMNTLLWKWVKNPDPYILKQHLGSRALNLLSQAKSKGADGEATGSRLGVGILPGVFDGSNAGSGRVRTKEYQPKELVTSASPSRWENSTESTSRPISVHSRRHLSSGRSSPPSPYTGILHLDQRSRFDGLLNEKPTTWGSMVEEVNNTQNHPEKVKLTNRIPGQTSQVDQAAAHWKPFNKQSNDDLVPSPSREGASTHIGARGLNATSDELKHWSELVQVRPRSEFSVSPCKRDSRKQTGFVNTEHQMLHQAPKDISSPDSAFWSCPSQRQTPPQCRPPTRPSNSPSDRLRELEMKPKQPSEQDQGRWVPHRRRPSSADAAHLDKGAGSSRFEEVNSHTLWGPSQWQPCVLQNGVSSTKAIPREMLKAAQDPSHLQEKTVETAVQHKERRLKSSTRRKIKTTRPRTPLTTGDEKQIYLSRSLCQVLSVSRCTRNGERPHTPGMIWSPPSSFKWP